MSELQVTLGTRNGDGREHLRYIYGGKEFPDTLFMESAEQREKSLRSAMRYFGIGTDRLTELSAQLIELASQAAQAQDEIGSKKERFPLVSCKALDAENYTPRALIADMLYALVVCIIGGIFKVCKSLVAIDAAISLATARPFLNHFTVLQAVTVVYFAGEGGPGVTQEYGRRIAASKGINLSDIGNLYWCFSVPRLADLHDLDAFTKVLDDTGAEVAVIDNLMLSMPGDTRAIVVEASWADLEQGEWRSKVTSSAAVGSVLGWIAAGIPIIMAEDHDRAGRYVSRLLFTAARRRWREARALANGIMAPMEAEIADVVE